MDTKILQTSYARGMIQDVSRHALPPGACWNMVDFIPDLAGAPLSRRGGWANASPALSGETRTIATAFATFSGGDQVIAFAQDGDLWKVDSNASATNKGATSITSFKQVPAFFNELLIIPDGSGSVSPKKYDGTAAPSALGGTPPAAKYAAAYKSFFALSGTTANPNRVYWSGALDPETWDTTSGYITMTQPVAGLASMRNALLVFSTKQVERIRGDIPPPGGDMVREPLFDIGCIDARSIATYGDKIFFANGEGVWITDGGALDNMIEIGGLSQYWRALISGYSSSWTISGACMAGFYFVTVTDGTTFQDALALDIRARTWWRISNLNSNMMVQAQGTSPEVYFASYDSAHLCKLSSIFTPSSNGNDGDGTAVQPVLETAFYRNKPGPKRWYDLYAGVDLYSNSGSPTITVSVTTDEADTSYDVLGTISEGASAFKKRQKMRVGSRREGIGFKFQQNGASEETRIWDLEASIDEQETSRWA